MKALVLFAPDDVRMVEKPVPKPGPGEVLIKVAACGICGTDAKIIHKGIPRMPAYGEFTFGHEWAGTIVALGDTVDEFKIGDRVAIEAHKGCGRCENCIAGKYTSCLNYGRIDKTHRASGMTVDGGFAQYAVHHINSIYKIPDNLSFVEATYVTTLGCALYAIDMVGGYIAGDSLLVIGPGPIGLSVVQGAKALGAEKIILVGTREDRLGIGRKLGATHIINIQIILTKRKQYGTINSFTIINHILCVSKFILYTLRITKIRYNLLNSITLWMESLDGIWIRVFGHKNRSFVFFIF